MSAKPWYPRYPRDFRAKTLHLNLTERGAYNALLDHYYEIMQSLPCERDALYRITGAFSEEDRNAVDRVAKDFFTNGDGTLTNARCEEEISKMKARSAQQSELAQRRWNKDTDAKASAKAMPARGISDGNASHSHSHISEVTAKTTTKKNKTKKGPKENEFALPDGIDPDIWNDFIEMRHKIRKPPTDRAKWLLTGKLFNLEQQGHPIRKVLQQSIRNGWQDVFPLRNDK